MALQSTLQVPGPPPVTIQFNTSPPEAVLESTDLQAGEVGAALAFRRRAPEAG